MLIGPQNSAVLVNQVRSRIRRAAEIAGRDPRSITLIAVGKGKPAESLRAAATAGVTDFGENYIQEAIAKMAALADLPLQWHFIGQLQSNKTRAVAERFEWVHSIDRFETARRLSDHRPHHGPPLNLCIQAALVPEPGKGGVAPPQVAELAARIVPLPRLRLRGLMCVPPPLPTAAERRAHFAELRRLLGELNALGLGLDTLSMGMSGDFEDAIAEGATHVRIGTAIFGERQPQGKMA
jgi:pyridoxal phosphate enzyme (YggS family)